jgi:hypothetical protein
VAVNATIDDLSRAFSSRDMNALKAVWPSIPKQDDTKLTKSFRLMQSFSRKFTPEKIAVNGDTATVSGSYSGSVVVGSAPTASNGTFSARLKKIGTRWVLDSLAM